MKLAILMMCYKNPDQINRLIDAFSNDAIDVYVHVDKKSGISGEIAGSGNITLIPDDKRVNVKWATFSQVETELVLLETASKNGCYDYYWLISGQDYPLVTPEVIISKLESKPGINYINLFPSKNYMVGKNTNYDKRNEIKFPDWMFKRDIFHRIIKRLWVGLTGGYHHTFKIFKQKESTMLSYYYGSQWWCLNRDFVNYALCFIKKNHSFIDCFHNSSCPDESFFQTLFMNSDYKSYREDYLHYIEWDDNSSSPKIITTADLERVFDSNKLMVRKIDVSVDGGIIDEIEKRKEAFMTK